MMSNKIRIKFGQIEFEAEGDSELIERERQQFFSLLPTAIAAVTPIVSSLSINDSVSYNNIQEIEAIDDAIEDINQIREKNENNIIYESLAALINDKRFENSVDLVIGVAYYLDKIKGICPFNGNDIADELNNARQPKLSNINSFINSNINKAYLIAEGSKKDNQKAFKISAIGISYVENYIPKENTKKRSTGIKKIAKQNIESPYLNITREELNLDRYPSIKKMSKFKEKMIMAMFIFMKENKGEYFTVYDLLMIMPHVFGESVTKKQIEGVLQREATWFNKMPDENNKKSYKYKLLNGATEYAEGLYSHE